MAAPHPTPAAPVEPEPAISGERARSGLAPERAAAPAPAAEPRTLARTAALLFVGTLALYARVVGDAFIRFDDNRYLTENGIVQRGLTWRGIAWAFTTIRSSNWHPLTWLSHMLDVQLFGMNPGAHHLVNAVLHAANAALVFLVLARMTGARGRSALVAALFAVHPLHVESVAWVSERKDVLSTLFGLLALWAYARHAERPGARRYAAVAVLFALSLLAKPMWVTLPFLLLLLDWWPLRRVAGAPGDGAPRAFDLPLRSWQQLVLEKAPLLALSAASSAVTVFAQDRGGALIGLELPLGARVANAAVSYARYLGKTLWPSSLAIFYPLPQSLPAWEVAAAMLLLVAMTGAALAWRRRLPWVAVGWCWFVGTLVPVIGIVQVGRQAMADRYTYLPLIGAFVAVVWGAHRVASRWTPRVAKTAAAIAILALAGLTWRQLGYWATNETLFLHALDVAPNALPHGVLADGYRAEGRLQEALAHARTAVQLDPWNIGHLNTLGITSRDAGLLGEAKDVLEEAVRLAPASAPSWFALGWTYEDLNDLDSARTAYDRTTQLAPDDPDPWFRLGVVSAEAGRVDEAVRAYRQVIERAPYHFAAWTNLAVLYQGAGRAPEAGEAFEAATRAQPDNFIGWRNLGVYRVKTGQHAGAADAFRQALRLKPRDPDVLRRLGLVAVTVGAHHDAMAIAAQLDGVDQAAAAEIRARVADAMRGGTPPP